MNTISADKHITLRTVNINDMDLIYGWRNDPRIIQLGLSSSGVDRDTHSEWFKESLCNSERILRVIRLSDKMDVGLLRLDRKNDFLAVVTIYLMHEFTGKGYGQVVLKMMDNIAITAWPSLTALNAEIRKENHPSITAFTRAGFVFNGSRDNGAVLIMEKRIEK